MVFQPRFLNRLALGLIAFWFCAGGMEPQVPWKVIGPGAIAGLIATVPLHGLLIGLWPRITHRWTRAFACILASWAVTASVAGAVFLVAQISGRGLGMTGHGWCRWIAQDLIFDSFLFGVVVGLPFVVVWLPMGIAWYFAIQVAGIP